MLLDQCGKQYPFAKHLSIFLSLNLFKPFFINAPFAEVHYEAWRSGARSAKGLAGQLRTTHGWVIRTVA